MPAHELSTTLSPWPRRLAFASAALAFPLLLLGGTVTTLRVGMAVPDWPTTFGSNMFTYPLSEMLASTGVFWEHSHRLWGAVVGLAVLSTALVTWIAEPRRAVRIASLASLAAVSLQGVLGGLRVLENSPDLAFVHGAVGQAVFALLGSLALVHTRAWRVGREFTTERAAPVRRVALGAALAVFVQIVVGAWLRHAGGNAPLAIHTALAALTAALVVSCASQLARTAAEVDSSAIDGTALARLARRLRWIVVAQLVLGLVTAVMVYVVTGPHRPVSIGEAIFATAHVAIGALLLQQCVAAALWSRRVRAPQSETVRAAFGGAL